MALLEVKDVRRSFGGLVAVNRVSFSVTSGQIKAVIGPNGAGKTTLFNIISGLLKADAGQVAFKDRSITGFKPYQIARAGISRTFQNPSLFFQMSVLENVMVGRHSRSHWEFAGCCLRFPGQPGRNGPSAKPPWRNWTTSVSPLSPGPRPERWLSANAAWWNWPARWPLIPNCCCSMSPPAD